MPMTPQQLLEYCDSGQLWPQAIGAEAGFDVAAGYRSALQLRQLRIARGERPLGYKVGFTNRQIWPRYNVFAPIWGVVWDSTVRFCDGQGELSLVPSCQPRIEPEAVFGMKRTPVPGASLDQLFAAVDWVAPGFEIVQSHLPGWKFQAADAVADGGLHARLLVGRKVPVADVAGSAGQFDALLAATRVSLLKGDELVDQGRGANVLDSPLRALHHFLAELRQCPGAPDLMPGDLVTTGTWTDAWPVAPGERWRADFSAPLPGLGVEFR
jgi:2-keto-4-pentenoate hydratase